MTAARSADPLGIYMVGFLHGRTDAEACQVAREQRLLAELAGDVDGVAWWGQVLGFLAVTGRDGGGGVWSRRQR